MYWKPRFTTDVRLRKGAEKEENEKEKEKKEKEKEEEEEEVVS